MAKMNIEYWKTEDIKPYENNPRINDGAVEATANSIKQFGWQQPIVVDKEFGYAIEIDEVIAYQKPLLFKDIDATGKVPQSFKYIR